MLRPSLRLDFGADSKLGPGKIRLLELIAETGSISQSARRLDNMSYRRAWLLVEALNGMFGAPVVTTKLGGSGGGGAEITPLGVELIRRYRDLERKVAALAEQHFAPLLAAAGPADGDAATADPRSTTGAP